MSVDGADVEMTLEVSVKVPNGIPSSTVRTVSENCRTLKIKDFGFVMIIDNVNSLLDCKFLKRPSI